MSSFANIDPKLEQFALQMNAVLTKDRPGYPEIMRTFQERRIDWMDEDLHKAIIIQPNFTIGGVDSSKWNFIMLAFCYDKESGRRIKWLNHLAKNKKFEWIEFQLDDFLDEAKRQLTIIKHADLK